MADVIQLLPDAIVNKIAAGEVIQRPASVVKELMENSIDAGSSNIKLVVKDAGKSLIQVIDDGCGMSETDARMALERHATSKIREAEDLFAIRTMGFRGEAMASIGAVAQMELRTRRREDELGTRILIEGSEIKTQEACQCDAGTNISVKNLFFNIPVRRNFLKSNTVEMRHILDEFQRIALANPDIFFSLHHNNSEIFHLPPSNLRQRVVNIFGTPYNKRLVPVEEETDEVKLNGFVSKPEFAKKTRGEQFFFVNQRFIRSAYLNHAVLTAFEDMLPSDTYPLYVVFIDIDPSRIDINVHPTKQEIKFEDERLIYNYLKVAIRHSLGKYMVTPTLDFDQEGSFSSVRIKPISPTRPTVRTFRSGEKNPGSDTPRPGGGGSLNFGSEDTRQKHNLQNWERLYEGLEEFAESISNPEEPVEVTAEVTTIESTWSSEPTLDAPTGGEMTKATREPYQIHGTYIVSPIKSGYILIDQQAAHERILYERYLDALQHQQASSQKQLFPRTITLPPADAMIMQDILPQINLLGYDIKEFGANTFVIHGIPADQKGKGSDDRAIETLLAQYKNNLDLKLNTNENIARSMARSNATKRGQSLTSTEMQTLIDQLFACQLPFKSPTGRNCFLTFELEELAKRFEKD